MLTNSNSWHDDAHSNLDDPFGAKFKILFDGFRKMFDQSLSKSKDLGEILRLLPGIVVQKNHISMHGMADLYRVKPDLLERLIKSAVEPLRLGPSIALSSIQPRGLPPSSIALFPGYILDDYLSGFLQDRDRSQLYYCDPILQHISIAVIF